MLNNYIKISVRHLWQNKLYSIINLAGLAVAITCVLLAVLFITDERSYDQFHQKRKDLYRIVTNVTDEKGVRKTVGGTGQPQGPAFKEAVPEIVDYASPCWQRIKMNISDMLQFVADLRVVII